MIKHIRKSKAIFYIEVIKGVNGNGKIMWQNLNKLLGRKKLFRNLQLQVNDTLTDDLGKIVNMFNTFIISSTEELTTHLKCPDILQNALNVSKPVVSIQTNLRL